MPKTKLAARTPFEGFPRTIVEEGHADGTALKHTTTPRYQGPWLARISDWLRAGLTLVSVGAASYAGLQLNSHDPVMISSLVAAPFATYAACHFGLPKLIRRSARVVFTPDHFIHYGLIKPKVFDRSLPHSFALFTHRKADREEERLSYKESKSAGRWWQGARKRYYGNSYHIAFQYMGQRHNLMTVYQHEIASKILARLKANDEAVEAKVGGGRGQALKPEDEWVDQSGSLDGFEVLGEGA